MPIAPAALFDKADTPNGLDVVFVTAHAEHAVRAFEVDAVDYLLKPVEPARLGEALHRLEAPSQARWEPEPSETPWAERDWLALPDGRSLEFVQIRSILSVTAEGDYTRVRTEDGSSRLVHPTMREWERRLPESAFLRIHRSGLVNLHRVTRVEEWSRYTYRVHLEGVEEPLPMSRRYAARARARLS